MTGATGPAGAAGGTGVAGADDGSEAPRAAARPDGMTTPGLAAPLVENWRLVVAAMLVAGALLAGGRVLLSPRRYQAAAVLATVSSQRLPAGVSGLAALSGLAAQAGGLTASPELVGSLLQSRRVLLRVAETPRTPLPGELAGAAGGDPEAGTRPAPFALAPLPVAPQGRRIVDAVADGPAPGYPRAVEQLMKDITAVASDKRTGLLTLSVSHRDSALARLVAVRLVGEASRAYLDLARSQAAAQRQGLEARVDSMGVLLRTAERRLAEFRSSNRSLETFSLATLDEQRLTRDINVAQQAYLQAITERESAVARELEQTPSIVVVDPVPAELDPAPRFAALFGLAGAVGAGFVAVTLVFLRDAVARLRVSGAPDDRRLLAALAALPLVGRLLGARRPGGAAAARRAADAA